MDIINLIGSYGPWSWILAGVVLLALELFVPGGFFVWLGVAGGLTGLAAMLWPIDWPWQFLIFGAASLVLIIAWLRFFKSRPQQSDRPLLNERASRYIGHEAVLNEPITDGIGRLALGDTVWRVAGPDLPAGQRVRVVGADAALLKVERV